MAANGSGLRFSTVRNIAAGWVFTLPAAALLSGLLLLALPLEPRHHLADVVDVDHKAAMGAPEERRVQQFQQLFQGAALGVALEGLRDHANHALVDGRVADLGLVDQQQPALRLDDQLGRAGAREAPCGRLSSRSSASSWDSIGESGELATPAAKRSGHAAAHPLHGLLRRGCGQRA
jgi:hypothetical protein